MSWPIEGKVRLGLGIAVAMLCGMGMIAYGLIVSFVRTSDWVIHTHLVIETAQGARTALDDAETAVRGYLLTQDETFLDPYNLERGRIPGVMVRLLVLTSDNPAQHHQWEQLNVQVDREMEILQRAVEAGRNPAMPSAERRKLLDEDQQVMSNIRKVLRESRLLEDQLLVVRDAAWRKDLTKAVMAAAILGLFNFVLLGSIYYVFKRDLTERRSAEFALGASKERLRLMIASVNDYAFFMLDPQGRVATWNGGAAIIKGYEASEIIGQHFSTFFTEEDRSAGKPALALDQAAKQGRVEIEGWRIRKDGSRFWANAITSAIRNAAGNLMGFSEVTRDLTERKNADEKIHQSQMRLAAILDGSPSVIFVKDPDGRYTLVNRKFEESFRMKREKVLGKTDMDLFPMDTALKLREDDVKTLGTGKALEFEEVIPQNDGAHTYLSSRVPLLGEDNKPYALCGVFTDITERKTNEQEIQKLNRALQDRVVNRSAQLMQAADELRMERAQRQGAEEREREVRERLHDVMKSSPVPMWTYDLETLALLDVNNAAVVLHGSSRETLLQSRMSDLYSPEEVMALGKEIKSGCAPELSPKIWSHRPKGESVIPVEILARRIEWEGRNAALVVAVSESEGRRLRQITQALEVADLGG